MSPRERKLWLSTLVVLLAIYSSLGLSRTLAEELRDRDLIDAAFWVGLFLVGGAVVLQAWRARLRGVEIGVALGIAGAYLIAFLRMTVPEERSHLIEYSVVAMLVHEALLERRASGDRSPRPALLALGITAGLGLLDEGIQALLPGRVADVRDVGFNTLAALLAVGGRVAVARARAWRRARAPS